MGFQVKLRVAAIIPTTNKKKNFCFSVGQSLHGFCPNYLSKGNHLVISNEAYDIEEVVPPSKGGKGCFTVKAGFFSFEAYPQVA